MATKTLSQNINQAISDFNGVKQAIIDKGVQIPQGTPTSQYGAKIGEIQSGGETPTKGYQITEWDADGYPAKVKLYGMSEIPEFLFYSAYNGSKGGCFRKLYTIEWCDGITSIEQFGFSYCNGLTLTSLPSGITSIGYYAFSSCSKLALTSLPSGITSIGNYAFYSCYELALTSLPSGITSIGNSVFQYCQKLALTSLPSGITSIGNYAFYSCSNLKTLSIGSAITSIGSNAFSSCSKLTQITIDRAEGSVSGAPWGATNATLSWVGTN